ncbi:DUF3035 domain-containing protein [Jannaschia sp. S6380]|uniref:DUF3035 domain-containing protein n=1 Tax=Jannaschia sp. S6380 TaxID=2926408 RepID=UPI001FF2F322|nr:DUF3035 domain-containing protein [Jannaschia sp. S6380]MCK0167866.1 DUF3035 domain-containing protein [Jannaschia sp. S6380]
MIGRLGIACALIVSLTACARENPTLFNVRKADRTPDEFSILPTRPLQTPPDLAALPTPTPGGANLVDPAPKAQAIAALGGRADGGGGADGPLVASVSRYGVQEDIRGVLAAEDLAFRRANDGRLLERVFNVNVYYRAYRPQSLDQYAELYRLRRAGVRTVAAPPDPAAAE